MEPIVLFKQGMLLVVMLTAPPLIVAVVEGRASCPMMLTLTGLRSATPLRMGVGVPLARLEPIRVKPPALTRLPVLPSTTKLPARVM